jgi:hypothetical protein
VVVTWVTGFALGFIVGFGLCVLLGVVLNARDG